LALAEIRAPSPPMDTSVYFVEARRLGRQDPGWFTPRRCRHRSALMSRPKLVGAGEEAIR
jgi:hypothetical protein